MQSEQDAIFQKWHPLKMVIQLLTPGFPPGLFVLRFLQFRVANRCKCNIA